MNNGKGKTEKARRRQTKETFGGPTNIKEKKITKNPGWVREQNLERSKMVIKQRYGLSGGKESLLVAKRYYLKQQQESILLF